MPRIRRSESLKNEIEGVSMITVKHGSLHFGDVKNKNLEHRLEPENLVQHGTSIAKPQNRDTTLVKCFLPRTDPLMYKALMIISFHSFPTHISD
jgi:hypothetical protein